MTGITTTPTISLDALGEILRGLLEDAEGECTDARAIAIRAVCAAIRTCGDGVAEIDADDWAPEQYEDDGPLYSTGDRALRVGWITVVNWQRHSRADWGDGAPGRPVGDWCCEENDDVPREIGPALAEALEALGLEDTCPEIEEPTAADETHVEDPDGDYAVLWTSSGEEDVVRAVYATKEAAQAVCDQWSRELAARYPGGNLLCGYVVAARDGDSWRWVALPDAEETGTS